MRFKIWFLIATIIIAFGTIDCDINGSLKVTLEGDSTHQDILDGRQMYKNIDAGWIKVYDYNTGISEPGDILRFTGNSSLL